MHSPFWYSCQSIPFDSIANKLLNGSFNNIIIQNWLILTIFSQLTSRQMASTVLLIKKNYPYFHVLFLVILSFETIPGFPRNCRRSGTRWPIRSSGMLVSLFLTSFDLEKHNLIVWKSYREPRIKFKQIFHEFNQTSVIMSIPAMSSSSPFIFK